jgi:predicted molibdopterin-dependent oxidoreductase YjgC
MNSIRLNIDGKNTTTQAGLTVLEVAQQAGIYIPTLCADPDLKPYGGCRLCVVKIEKMRGLPTACTTEASDGMVVHTQSITIHQARRTVIDLLITDHPLDCLTCIKNQHCELQKAAAYLGVTERRFPRTEHKQPIDESNPFFKLDRNYCILCAKCTRTCDEISGINAIEIAGRGYQSRVSTLGNKSFMESICHSCGECVVRCPVAALVPNETTQPASTVATVCPYCGVGCGMYLGIRDEHIVSVSGDRENPASRGRLCVKGRFGITEFVHHPERLTHPLIRKDDQLKKASWNEALTLVAEKLASYKPEETAVIASAKATNEDNYILQKFARTVLATNNIDHCARL